MAEGFMGGLMEGLISQVAPAYFNSMKQEEQATAKAQYAQQQMDTLGSAIAKTYDPMIANEKNPARRLTYQQMKELALTKSPLLAEFFPKAIEQAQKYNFEETSPTSNMKDVEYTAQVDPENYPPAVRAKLMAEHLVRPSTSINMGGLRPAPASGYMYATSDNNDPTQTFIPGGPADPSKKPMTDSEGKALSFYESGKAANDIYSNLESGIKEHKLDAKHIAESIPIVGDIAGIAVSSTMSPEQQQAENAQRTFINSIVRSQTGADAKDSEMANLRKMFFPDSSASPELKKQMHALRGVVLDSLYKQAGENLRKPAEQPKQKDAASQNKTKVSRKVIRTGTDENGLKVYLHADGSTDFTPY